MSQIGELTVDELYTLSEQQIITKILHSKNEAVVQAFENFQNATRVYRCNGPHPVNYSTNVRAKTRYINPLVSLPKGAKRISCLSEQAAKDIQNYLDFPKGGYYTCFNFSFCV